MDEQKLNDAIANPQNLGEMADADSVGTVGSPDCGDMVRMWLKFKEENGRKVIDRASFQSFGCQTAIPVASLPPAMLKGTTVDEARQLKAEEMTGDIGALPPMKIHCGQLVEGALKNALDNDGASTPQPTTPARHGNQSPTLADSLRSQPAAGKGKIRIVKLTDDNDQ